MADLTRHQLAMLACRNFDALLGAGYSASDLRDAGYSASALLGAGYSASDLRDAGYPASALLGAGYSASDLRDAGYSLSDELRGVPLVENPYSHLLTDIEAKRRLFQQSTWGPESAPTPEPNICKTPMCTAGHLVSLAGKAGWELKEKYGFVGAAALIHAKAHPDYACQNFGPIPDSWALAYIEEMAEIESKQVTK